MVRPSTSDGLMSNDDLARFGPFEFDLHSLELRKAGYRRKLQQQPARVLRVLIERAGQLVTREELRRHLWPDDTFVDFEVGLNAAVGKLRSALGESRDRPRYIETLARRGYRFHFRDDTSTARRPLNSVAVLPFESLSPDAEYLSDGITEIVIQAISILPGVRKVIARNSVYRFRNGDPLETAKYFNVQAVVVGRMEVKGDRIVLDAELVSAVDAHRIWGARYETAVTDLPRLVSKEMCANMAEAFGTRKRHPTPEPPTFEAYQLYLRGRYAWNKRPAVGTVEKAMGLFEQAIRMDPRFALPNVGLADSFNTLAAWESGALAPRVGFPKGKQAAIRALQQHPSCAEAHTSLGYATLHYDWDLAAAEGEFTTALRLNPNYSHAHHWYSHLLAAAGRLDEALAESRRILELDPLDLIINVHLAWHYYMARQFEKSLEEARRVLDMERSFHWGYYFAGLALEALAEKRDAVRELEKAVELSGRSTVMLSALGYTAAAGGDADRATAILTELGEIAKSRYVSSFEVALIHAALADVDTAFACLERAYEERSGWLPYAGLEPRLAALRPDPRFQRLLARVGLPSRGDTGRKS